MLQWTYIKGLSDLQLGHLKWNMHDLNFWFEGHKTGATSSLNFDRLYTSGGVDFSGLSGLQRAHSPEGLSSQPSISSDTKLVSLKHDKAKYSFWFGLVTVAQASPALPKAGPYVPLYPCLSNTRYL
jgi:hypothetical protein